MPSPLSNIKQHDWNLIYNISILGRISQCSCSICWRGWIDGLPYLRDIPSSVNSMSCSCKHMLSSLSCFFPKPIAKESMLGNESTANNIISMLHLYINESTANNIISNTISNTLFYWLKFSWSHNLRMSSLHKFHIIREYVRKKC